MKVGSIHKNSKTRYFAVGGYFCFEEDRVKIRAKYKKENFLAKKTFRILFDTKCLFYFYLFRFQTLTWFTTNKL